MHSANDGSRNTPTVSVCIPMYNNATTIERCLGSVLTQEGIDFEVLVVDDDSRDDSAAIVSAALRPGDRLIRNDSRLGIAGNHNRCLEHARGTYIQFVHADDWLLPGALRTLARELNDSNAGMVFAPRQVVTKDAEFLRKYGRPHAHFRSLRQRNEGSSLVLQIALFGIHGNWVGEPTCVMFRRHLAFEAGMFRDDIYQLLDLDLWLRLMLRSTVSFLPRELSARCHNGDTESARNKAIRRDWLDQLRVITSMVVDPSAPPLIRVVSLVWWFLIWPRVVVEGVALGPERYAHLKASVSAPFCEFASARSIFAAPIRDRPSLVPRGGHRGNRGDGDLQNVV